MKGLEISQEIFKAIINDYAWSKFLVHKDGNVFVDLKKYSDNKFYLPIKSEFQSYCVGFKFTNDLYACPYRDQNDLVCIYPEEEKYEMISYISPIIDSIKIDSYSDPSFPPEIRTEIKYRTVKK